MRFGCCTNWFGQDTGSDKFVLMDQRLSILDEASYDFVELAVGMLTPDLPDQDFKRLVDLVNGHKVTVDAFNVFIPAKYPLIGPDRDLEGALEHVDFTADRMAALGGSVVVFGSGGARRVPEGFDHAKATEQILEFIDKAAPLLKSRGITMVLEHLNRNETNMINSVAEAKELLKQVKHDNVKLLGDYYHMLVENEPLDVLDDTEGQLMHVHVADEGRVRPGAGGADFKALRQHLDKAGYDLRVSVECRFEDFAREAGETLQFLRKIWA